MPRIQVAPRVILFGLLAVLLLTWTLVLTVDVFNILGARDRVFTQGETDFPHVYFHWANNQGPIEWFQWAFLVAGSVGAGIAAGIRFQCASLHLAKAIAFFSLLLGVLAVKDAGSPRHIIAGHVESVTGEQLALVSQLLVLLAMGSVALMALFLLFPYLPRQTSERRYLLVGSLSYGVAASMSATSFLWYERAGEWILRVPFRGRVLEAPVLWEGQGQGTMFMDTVVEESVELVGAGFLAATALAILRSSLAAHEAQKIHD